MPEHCDNCPFNAEGEGRFLRDNLRPGRWAAILRGLRNGRHFVCHKTSTETGNGKNLLCAGAIAWQERRGISSNLARIYERFVGLARGDDRRRPAE